jgi:hypothetical protein
MSSLFLSTPVSHLRSEVKRILVMSSCASIRSASETKVFSEEDWNEESISIVKENGDLAPGIDIYRASKTLAEKGEV